MAPEPTAEQLDGCTPDELRAERRWFDRLEQALRSRDENGRVVGLDRSSAEPFRTLFRQALEVLSNDPQFMLIPDEGPCTYEPNPWHADPADPQVIGRGMKNVWDRIGAAAGIGPAPASVGSDRVRRLGPRPVRSSAQLPVHRHLGERVAT